MNKYLGEFKVVDYSILQTKLGTPYMKLDLEKSDGHIDTAFCFDNIAKIKDLIYRLSFISIHGTIFTRNNKNYMRILKIGSSFADFYETYFFKLKALGNLLKDEFCHTIFNSFFKDLSFTPNFLTLPASIAGHHSYCGGLLVHTTDCMELGYKIAETDALHTSLNRDILLTGLFLHDIGKALSYSYINYHFYMSDEGKAVGHVNLGHQMFEEKCSQIEDFPKKLKNTLANIILSHHNSGIVKPLSNEAVMVKKIDSISAWSDMSA